MCRYQTVLFILYYSYPTLSCVWNIELGTVNDSIPLALSTYYSCDTLIHCFWHTIFCIILLIRYFYILILTYHSYYTTLTMLPLIYHCLWTTSYPACIATVFIILLIVFTHYYIIWTLKVYYCSSSSKDENYFCFLASLVLKLHSYF